MKDFGIDKGIVQEFNTSEKRNKGNKWGFRKMFWDYLNKLHVPFYDMCCSTSSVEDTTPVRYFVTNERGSVQHFDPETETWVEVQYSTDEDVTMGSVQLIDGGITLSNGNSINGAGSTIATFMPTATQQTLSGAGAMNITSYNTRWTTTAADAATLANAQQIGQLKKITLVVDGGDGTLTPANLDGGTTITFNDAGDYVVLIWNGTDWVVIENSGATVA